jgi:hypothetical protein
LATCRTSRGVPTTERVCERNIHALFMRRNRAPQKAFGGKTLREIPVPPIR